MSQGSIDITSIAQGKTDLISEASQPAQSTKATQYIKLLYNAKCEGRWESVPELVRKVEKHAPSRECIVLASKSAARVYANPTAANFKSTENELGPALASAIQSEDTYATDILDSTVCRAVLLFGAGQPQDVLAQIPVSLHQIPAPAEGQGVLAWLGVCVLQGTLVRGLAQEALHKHADAIITYGSIIQYIAQIVGLPNQCSELRRWTEDLLAHICLVFASTDPSGRASHLGEAMATFHLLSRFLENQSWKPLAIQGTFTKSSPRDIWRAYYETLSTVIKEDLVYHPSSIHKDHAQLEHRGSLDNDEFTACRNQQRADLRRVETNYETLLLKDTQFPQANEVNDEINSWVELVMGNWRILCGPSWANRELGLGGKPVVARNTLDILYRAATKTFHSTQILRHLFTVHVFLAEFDIAFRAFDTYVEIMNKGKARQAKSGLAGITLDDDDTAVRFTSGVVGVACKFGSESFAEKALNIGETLSHWILEGQDTSHANSSVSKISSETRSIGYRAIGISQAQFARSTPLPASRTLFQERAIDNLSRSIKQSPESNAYTESFYALSLILAETRDIHNAVQTAKQAIQIFGVDPSLAAEEQVISSNQPGIQHPSNLDINRTSVKQVPIWHLLVQLLCAREEFEMAQKCCDSAFDQVGGLSSFLYSGELSLAQNGTSTAPESYTLAAIDSMSNLDKQSILELKMTQLLLVQINEGVDAAVNGTNELLGLFASLLGMIDSQPSRKSEVLVPPKSSSGTVRSVFGRPKSMRRTILVDNHQSGLASKTTSAVTSRPTTSATTRPNIRVTNSDGNTKSPSPDGGELNEKTKHNTLRKKNSTIRESNTVHDAVPSSEISEQHLSSRVSTSGKGSQRVSFQQDKAGETEAATSSAPQPLGEVPTNMEPQKKPPPSGQVAQTPEQDTRLPVPHPNDETSSLPPLFIAFQEKWQKISLLVKIWLFAARLYSNLYLLEDAKGAVDEARKLVYNLEVEISHEKPSVSRFQERGWGGGRSLEELWADVYAEEGKILENQSLPHDAMLSFEKALSHQPDHLEATIGVSNILLDIYSQDIPPEKTDISRDLLSLALNASSKSSPNHQNGANDLADSIEPSHDPDSDPSEISRLASRDRAYGLLSSITKLGAGWDSPEAWFALSRAYEMSGQTDKAKEALWWTVRLEDTRPIRHWRNVNLGGYVL